MKAFSVVIPSWGEGDRTIVAAETRGQAISDLAIAAQECGYKVAYTGFRATRAPEFDALAEAAKNKQTLGWQAEGVGWGCLSDRGNDDGRWTMDD